MLMEEVAQANYALAGRRTYLKINLRAILSNIEILQGQCSNHTKVIAVVKANAYGHGSVEVSKYLEKNGIETFAVATGGEGAELRKAGIKSDIQVLGNVCPEELPTCVENCLIPTVAAVDPLAAWVKLWQARTRRKDGSDGQVPDVGRVIIKVDTGMSRNGCQPHELPALMQFCQNNDIPVHSIMTHFAQSWDDPAFTQQQLNVFRQAVEPFRKNGVKLHVSNSGAIVNGVGVDLDYVRPGISMYGQPPDTSQFGIETTRRLGLRPAICWLTCPSLVKVLQQGRVVGYDQTYRVEKDEEIIASFPLGYADGYCRLMFGAGKLTTDTGVECDVVGRISMDGITARLPEAARESRDFYVLKDDFDSVNSTVSVARVLETIPYEVCTNLSPRIPRLYDAGGSLYTGSS